MRRSSKPTVRISCSSQAWSGLRPAIERGSTRFSSAVSTGRRLKNWKMKPSLSRRSWVSSASSRWVISVPSTSTVPEVGRSSPARMCMRVDLPDPDGPMIAVKRSRSKSTLRSLSASTAASPSPYRRLTSLACTMAPFLAAGAWGACAGAVFVSLDRSSARFRPTRSYGSRQRSESGASPPPRHSLGSACASPRNRPSARRRARRVRRGIRGTAATSSTAGRSPKAPAPRPIRAL